jgi:hypothetical protein
MFSFSFVPFVFFSGRYHGAVEWPTAVAQAFRGLFGCDIALRLGHELVPDEKLPHGGAAQKGWVEVDVEVAGFNLFGCAGERSLVEAHACITKSILWSVVLKTGKLLTVREIRLEQVVVSLCDFRHNFCEVCTLLVVEIRQGSLV